MVRCVLVVLKKYEVGCKGVLLQNRLTRILRNVMPVFGSVFRPSRPLDSEDEGITFLRGFPNLSLKDKVSHPRSLNPQPHLLENLIPGRFSYKL
jgi:hypothetical protein